MTPVMQTIFGGGEGGKVPGNCSQAAMASVLDLPLDAVPHFLIFRSMWEHAMRMWLTERGLVSRFYVAEWLREDQEKLDNILGGAYIIGSGKGARGYQHATVWQKKDNWFIPIHDPHPDKTFYDGSGLTHVRWLAKVED